MLEEFRRNETGSVPGKDWRNFKKRRLMGCDAVPNPPYARNRLFSTIYD
jgi:hypothetical protein